MTVRFVQLVSATHEFKFEVSIELVSATNHIKIKDPAGVIAVL